MGGGGGGGGGASGCVCRSRVYACAHNYCGLGHTQRGQRQDSADFLISNAVVLAKSPFCFSSACFAKAVGIAHKLRRCL